MKWLKFIMFLVLYSVIGWYLTEGLLWLTFLLKPYTELGQTVTTWIEHIFVSLGFIMLAIKHSEVLD